MQRQLGMRQAQLRRGGDSGGASTLAAVYAAGAAPVTDDIFTMSHGKMRFQAATDGNPLPVLGYWEDTSGFATAASGTPADLYSLAVQIGGGASGRRFTMYQMFDPAWNGSLNGINGMSWEVERVTFTNNATQAYFNQNTNPAYGSRDWKAFSNYAPTAYPQGASGNGAIAHETALFNTVDNGLRFIERMDGWGQTNVELLPQQNGITWQWASHWNNANIGVPAANDGIGWGVYAGDLSHTNHVQAGLVARQVTNDPQGDWYWSFFVPDGSGGLLDVADFAKSGVSFYVPGVAAQYTTALLDLTVAADNISISIPQRVGFIFCPRLLTLLVRDGAGTATSSLTWSVGNNAAHNNTGTLTTSAASLNALIPVAPQPAFGNGGGATALLDSSTQIVAKISTAVTGVASLHGYLSVSGFWVPT